MDDFAYTAALAAGEAAIMALREAIADGAQASVLPSCPFQVGDRVKDDIFGTGVVVQLGSSANLSSRGAAGQVLIKWDDASSATPVWRAWDALKKRPAESVLQRTDGIRAFFVPGADRASRARQGGNGGSSALGSAGGSGSSDIAPMLGGVQLPAYLASTLLSLCSIRSTIPGCETWLASRRLPSTKTCSLRCAQSCQLTSQMQRT